MTPPSSTYATASQPPLPKMTRLEWVLSERYVSRLWDRDTFIQGFNMAWKHDLFNRANPDKEMGRYCNFNHKETPEQGERLPITQMSWWGGYNAYYMANWRDTAFVGRREYKLIDGDEPL